MPKFSETCSDSLKILTCRIKNDPEYSPMKTLILLILVTFLVLPYFSKFINYITFSKFYGKSSLIEILQYKREKLIKQFTSKKRDYFINSEFAQYIDTNTGGSDYTTMKLMRAHRQMRNIQFGNINQVSPLMLYTEQEEIEGGIGEEISIKNTHSQAINLSIVSSSKHFSRPLNHNIHSKTVLIPRELNQVSLAYSPGRRGSRLNMPVTLS